MPFLLALLSSFVVFSLATPKVDCKYYLSSHSIDFFDNYKDTKKIILFHMPMGQIKNVDYRINSHSNERIKVNRKVLFDKIFNESKITYVLNSKKIIYKGFSKSLSMDVEWIEDPIGDYFRIRVEGTEKYYDENLNFIQKGDQKFLQRSHLYFDSDANDVPVLLPLVIHPPSKLLFEEYSERFNKIKPKLDRVLNQSPGASLLETTNPYVFMSILKQLQTLNGNKIDKYQTLLKRLPELIHIDYGKQIVEAILKFALTHPDPRWVQPTQALKNQLLQSPELLTLPGVSEFLTLCDRVIKNK